MNELDNLIDILDKNEHIKKIKELNKKIEDDKDLVELIKKYQDTKDEKTKEQIINNSLFSKYKIEETEVNLIIMNINSKLKKITSSKECNL